MVRVAAKPQERKDKHAANAAARSKAAASKPGSSSASPALQRGPSTPSPPARVRVATCKGLTYEGLGCTHSLLENGGSSADGATASKVAITVTDRSKGQPAALNPASGQADEAAKAAASKLGSSSITCPLDAVQWGPDMSSTKAACEALTGKGMQCKTLAVGDGLCTWHRGVEEMGSVVIRISRVTRPPIIRRGQGPWPYETLGCTPVCLPITRQATGVGSVAADTRRTDSWFQLWSKACRHVGLDPICSASGCQSHGCVGGHLWLYDAAKQRYDFEHCYIAPLCSWHNGMRFAYLESILLKAGVLVMRIVPHEEYQEYQHRCASPNRPPMPPLPRIRSKLPRPTVIRNFDKATWAHNHPGLGCMRVPLPESRQAAGVNKSTKDKASRGWRQMWGKVVLGTGFEPDPLCFVQGCPKLGNEGAHLWLFDEAKGQYDHENCYIAPTCNRHNSWTFNLREPTPNKPIVGFRLRRNVTVMRIVPHDCYGDYEAADCRKILCFPLMPLLSLLLLLFSIFCLANACRGFFSSFTAVA